jgi:hypothetical protein
MGVATGKTVLVVPADSVAEEREDATGGENTSLYSTQRARNRSMTGAAVAGSSKSSM